MFFGPGAASKKKRATWKKIFEVVSCYLCLKDLSLETFVMFSTRCFIARLCCTRLLAEKLDKAERCTITALSLRKTWHTNWIFFFVTIFSMCDIRQINWNSV